MKPENLEAAIEVRDRLKQLLVFKGAEWKGAYQLTFGGYEMTLSPAVRDLVDAAIDGEEKQLRNTLEILGVDAPDA